MESTIRFVTDIKMNPNRNHPLQDMRGRLNRNNASFRSPRPESFDPLARAHRDRDIVMPSNLPIRLWDFAEEDAMG
jgi:hypothetical protein